MPSDKRARQRAAREARLAAEAQRQKRRKQIRNGIIALAAIGLVIGLVFAFSGGSNNKNTAASHSGSTTTKPNTTGKNAQLQDQANTAATRAGCPASTKTTVNQQKYAAAPAMSIDATKTYTAAVKTTTGDFVITLDPKTAPMTVNNFVFLAEKGFYHCVIFHRVIPGFMNQAGDPTGTGTGGPGYTIKDELPAKAANPAQQYPLGSVVMANTGSPNTGGSQFFIVAGAQGESLPNSYAQFGQITSGMNVVGTINQQGNSNPSANGEPPDVTQRILFITIHSS